MNPRTGLLVSLAIIVAACEVVPSNLPALPPTPVSGIPAPAAPPRSDDIASKTYPQPLSVPQAEEIPLAFRVTPVRKRLLEGTARQRNPLFDNFRESV